MLFRSQKLDPAAGTALNLGDCSEHLGRLASAWQYYQEAADRFGADDRAEVARRKVAELAPRLARLDIKLAPGAPKGAVVFRDGQELGGASLDTPLPIDAGDHHLVVRAPGHEAAEVVVHIEDGQSRTITCGAGAESAAAPAPAGVARPVGLVVGGLGIAAIGVGAVTGALTLARKDTVAANCDAAKACNPVGVAAASEGKMFSAISTATFLGGAAALAAGVVLVIVGRSGDRSGPVVAVVTTVAPGGAGFALTGRF